MKIEQSALVNPPFRRTLLVEASIMFAHAQQKYSRSVHLRFVAAQDFMIRRCMPRTPQVIGSADNMLAYSTGLVGRK